MPDVVLESIARARAALAETYGAPREAIVVPPAIAAGLVGGRFKAVVKPRPIQGATVSRYWLADPASVHGVVALRAPKAVDITTFDAGTDYHGMEKALREATWPGVQTLYVHEVVHVMPLLKPEPYNLQMAKAAALAPVVSETPPAVGVPAEAAPGAPAAPVESVENSVPLVKAIEPEPVQTMGVPEMPAVPEPPAPEAKAAEVVGEEAEEEPIGILEATFRAHNGATGMHAHLLDPRSPELAQTAPGHGAHRHVFLLEDGTLLWTREDGEHVHGAGGSPAHAHEIDLPDGSTAKTSSAPDGEHGHGSSPVATHFSGEHAHAVLYGGRVYTSLGHHAYVAAVGASEIQDIVADLLELSTNAVSEEVEPLAKRLAPLTGASRTSMSKPFAGFADFGACVAKMRGEGHDETSARKICGALEARARAAGMHKAIWTTATVNKLPDSAFLYVESGGEKDADGKTVPRSKRHFPYRDGSGKVDVPHLRNAIARIPRSKAPGLTPGAKKALQEHARKLLHEARS